MDRIFFTVSGRNRESVMAFGELTKLTLESETV